MMLESVVLPSRRAVKQHMIHRLPRNLAADTRHANSLRFSLDPENLKNRNGRNALSASSRKAGVARHLMS
jgi:hypothetical protein